MSRNLVWVANPWHLTPTQFTLMTELSKCGEIKVVAFDLGMSRGGVYGQLRRALLRMGKDNALTGCVAFSVWWHSQPDMESKLESFRPYRRSSIGGRL